jgi:hypothetical protein
MRERTKSGAANWTLQTEGGVNLSDPLAYERPKRGNSYDFHTNALVPARNAVPPEKPAAAVDPSFRLETLAGAPGR